MDPPVTVPEETTAPVATAPPGPDGAAVAKPRPPKETWRVVLEWGVLIAGALLIAFLIRTFLFQAFYIPSESMTPTLEVGDRVLVNKLSYRLHDVHRGDIVVFEAPKSEQARGVKDFVKRVVGLPGETVEFQDGKVFVDGRVLDEGYLPDGVVTCAPGEGSDAGACRPRDANDDIVPFAGLCKPPVDASRCVVPADHYLVLGDNRENSSDGRVFGPIGESDIIGRVFVRIWPITDLDLL